MLLLSEKKNTNIAIVKLGGAMWSCPPPRNIFVFSQGSLTNKGLTQTRGPYRQMTSIDAVQFLQTKGPYRQLGSPTDEGPLHTLCYFYR